MDRAAWLAERRKGLGASDAAPVLGLSPYATALEVYLDKLGMLPEQETAPMRWGLKLEEAIATAYEEETGRALHPPGDPIWWHPEVPWMFASPDRIHSNGEERLVELKTARTAEGWGCPGTDEVPAHYLVQVQHQMACTGARVADLAVLVGGSDFRVYTVAWHPRLIDTLIERLGAFWAALQKREPPEPLPPDPRLLDLLYRPAEGVSVELGPEAAVQAGLYAVAQEMRRQAEGQRERAKAALIALLGEASEGRLPDGRRVVRKVVSRKGYAVKDTEYVHFSIRGATNGERGGTE